MERESLLSRQQKKKTLGCSHGMSWLCEATSMEMVTFHVFFSAQNWVWLKFSVQRRHPLAIKHGNWQSPMNKGFHMPYMGKSFELPMDAFQMPCRFTGGKKTPRLCFSQTHGIARYRKQFRMSSAQLEDVIHLDGCLSKMEELALMLINSNGF